MTKYSKRSKKPNRKTKHSIASTTKTRKAELDVQFLDSYKLELASAISQQYADAIEQMVISLDAVQKERQSPSGHARICKAIRSGRWLKRHNPGTTSWDRLMINRFDAADALIETLRDRGEEIDGLDAQNAALRHACEYYDL